GSAGRPSQTGFRYAPLDDPGTRCLADLAACRTSHLGFGEAAGAAAVLAVSPGRTHSRAGGTRVLARSIDRAGPQQLPRHAAPAPPNLGRRTLGDALERPVRGGLTGRGGFRRQSLRARRHGGTRTTPEGRRYDAARGGADAVRWRFPGARSGGRLASRAARPAAQQVRRRARRFG